MDMESSETSFLRGLGWLCGGCWRNELSCISLTSHFASMVVERIEGYYCELESWEQYVDNEIVVLEKERHFFTATSSASSLLNLDNCTFIG
jgi:hypothetical protein